MTRIIEGALNGTEQRFGIVISRFNHMITDRLSEGARECLRRHGVIEDNITICYVPGSFEIPLVARKLAQKANIDAVICLGAIIRGSTAHFDYVAGVVAQGVAEASRATDTPVLFGVLTTNTIEQALERAGTKAGNRGWDAALAAIEMVDVIKQIR